MTGNFIDTIRYSTKRVQNNENSSISFITTAFGKVRVLDTASNKPVIVNVPDGPNVIEHHQELIELLSQNYRVICFEFPGIGFSYPNAKFDYSFDKASKLVINILDILKVARATLAFSCSNGFYAIKTAQGYPHRVERLILSQTPSTNAMKEWTKNTVPIMLKIPIVGQILNGLSEKKLANIWYKYALPKSTPKKEYQDKAIKALEKGGCFCLSSLVQGLEKEKDKKLSILNIPTTLIWGSKDFTHRNTDKNSIRKHIPNCEIIEFKDCGHFPELEQTEKYVELINERC